MTQVSEQLPLRQRIVAACLGLLLAAATLIGTIRLVNSRETLCRPDAEAGRVTSLLNGIGCGIATYAPQIGREAKKLVTHATAHEAWKRLSGLK